MSDQIEQILPTSTAALTIPEFTDDEIVRAMPHPTARPGQVKAIRYILDSFRSGKRIVVLEAPTGAGKSAIGLTVASLIGDSYYLTIQKILQSQISRDYHEAGLVELKGRNAYPCTFYENFRKTIELTMTKDQIEKEVKSLPDCAMGYCKKHLGRGKCSSCMPPKSEDGCTDKVDRWRAKWGVQHSVCPYFEQVGLALESQKVLMNFSSFLFQTQYAGRFGQRDLMVIDEGHQTEPQIMSFVSLTINDLALRANGIEIPNLADAEEYAVWFEDMKFDRLVAKLILDAKEEGDLKKQDELTQLYSKYKRFVDCVLREGMSDWTCEWKETTFSKGGKSKDGYRTVTFRPIFVRHFANDLLFKFGKKVLIMSATILDVGVLASSLGMKGDEVAYYKMKNRFPVENRPIYIETAAKMSGGRKKMDEWGPKLVKKVDELLERHKDERGIIHGHSFAICEHIATRCKGKGRFLLQKDFKSKEEMLLSHSKRPNGVILAPAMHEGLDLKGDLSRFQIVAKIPWPNFYDDVQLSARVDRDPRYLLWLTALKLVQSVGRSVRSETDWAVTYVLDELYYSFARDASAMLPKWFTEAVIDKGSGKRK